MKFKKIAAIISAAAVALALTGCGKNETTYGGNTTQSKGTAANSKANNPVSTFGSGSNAPETPLPDNLWEVIPEIPVTEESAFTYGYDEVVGGVVVTDYLGQSKDVRIPNTFDGKPVVKVDLTQCQKKLTELVMPDSVKSFELSAASKETLQYANVPAAITEIKGLFNKMYGDEFGYSCNNLTSVFIPDSVTKLGMYAFGGCESLASITLPDGMTKIGEGAFYLCESLTNITIPDSVTVIDNNAFYGCENIQITYKGKTYDYEHIDDLYEAINYGE